MHQRQRQATLQRQVGEARNSSNSQRRTARYTDPDQGAFSAPVARLSKWPKNIFFASDFIADRVAASGSVRHRATKPSRTTAARCPNIGPGKSERRSSAQKVDLHEPRPKEGSTCPGSSGGRRTLQQGTEGFADGDGKRDVGVAEVEVSFIERSARALLVLHSRFFGSVKREDDIVCCLCKLCREAGWMGDPRRQCRALDPLILDELVTEQQRGKQSSESGRRSRGSITYPETKSGSVTFSFEDLYRSLATIATLVYPRTTEGEREGARPGRAMHRLLMEGVLPLAADNQPRQWSPRPEILYGRPALAALSKQRDTLLQLYCTYDDAARANDGSGGFSWSMFRQMLADLGISPASVSESRAASVFDNTIRNGRPAAKPLLRQEQPQGKLARRVAGDGSNGSADLRWRSRQKESSREPEKDRLDWSLFLEAMAALAVGAVKDGQGRSTKQDRTRTLTASLSSWNRIHRDCDIQERPGAACKAVPGWTEHSSCPGRRDSNLPVETGWILGGASQMSDKCTVREDQAATQVRGNIRAEVASGMVNQPYGRVFYHDSKKSIELMPTLPEGGSPQERVDLLFRPPSNFSRPKTSQAKECTSVKGSTSGTRVSEPLPAEIKASTEEGNPKATTITTTKHLVGSETRSMKRMEGRARGEKGYNSIKKPPPVIVQTGRGGGRSGRVVEPPLPRSLRSDDSVAERSSVPGGESCARVVPDRSKTGDRTATSNVAGAAECRAVGDHRTLTDQRLVGDTTSPFEADYVSSKEEALDVAFNGGPGHIRETPPSSSTQDVSIAMDTDGRHTCRQQWFAPGESGHKNLRGCTAPHAKDDILASDVLDASSNPTGGSVGTHGAVSTDNWAYFEPVMARFSSPFKTVDGKDIVRLSPAPCHGGSPSALSSYVLPVAVEHSNGATYSTPVDTALPSAVLATTRAGANERDKPLCQLRVQCQMDELRPGCKNTETSGCRSGNRKKGTLRCADGKMVREKGDTDERHHESGQESNYADRITMDIEAAGCTAEIFEELLKPEIVAAYCRHRKELLEIFQRYRIKTDGENRRPTSTNQDLSGCIDDSGIRRLVNDLPALRRWAEGDSILSLIVRASRERGQQRYHQAPLGSSSGLSYFGFLEVLTRMAYATYGQQPLHAKFLDLLSALNDPDPSGILTF